MRKVIPFTFLMAITLDERGRGLQLLLDARVFYEKSKEGKPKILFNSI